VGAICQELAINETSTPNEKEVQDIIDEKLKMK